MNKLSTLPTLPLLIATLLACTSAQAAKSANSGKDARALHERLLVLDTHLDSPANFARPGWDIMQRHDYATDMSQVDYPRMVEGGLDGGFWAVFTPQGPRTPQGTQAARNEALLTTLRIREMVAAHPREFVLALTAADAGRIAASGKRIVYLSIENGYPLGTDASLMETFYQLGVRLFGPVHFRNNDLGDSSTDTTHEWNGLSPLGKQLITEANRLGIVLDASHASDDVLDQMIELSKTPVLLSHSGCKAVFDHPRNVDDERLRKLAAAGGVIQMNSLSDYLIPTTKIPEREAALAVLNAKYGRQATVSELQRTQFAAERRTINAHYPVARATLDDFMKHVLHALEVVGPDHVGIGADWDGGGGITGMEDVAAIPAITARLLQAGYSEQDLAKIWSGNVLRVLRTAEEYKARAQ
jgi:membrane dipeptidase